MVYEGRAKVGFLFPALDRFGHVEQDWLANPRQSSRPEAEYDKSEEQDSFRRKKEAGSKILHKQVRCTGKSWVR